MAVLAITLFRAFSRAFHLRRASILENNIVQTAGSAGESIAFGVGVTMPALLLLGFQMEPVRIMVVSVLGGILGILAMIPLRRAFIVKMHGLSAPLAPTWFTVRDQLRAQYISSLGAGAALPKPKSARTARRRFAFLSLA